MAALNTLHVHTRGCVSRALKKAMALQDEAVAALRHEVRQTLQLAMVQEDEIVERSQATMRRNKELQMLLQTAHENNQVLMKQVHVQQQDLEAVRVRPP
jgi:hypothetical protein